ncbi:MAG: ATPase P [Eubacterium sp.]|nr:ATPase P [Eubacterium sp.]
MYKTIASVDGMMCDMCEAHINERIRKSFAVKKVTSSHKKNQSVIISEQALTRDQIESALAPIGYHCLGAESQACKKGLFGYR